jgi:hypothetical protein
MVIPLLDNVVIRNDNAVIGDMQLMAEISKIKWLLPGAQGNAVCW